jgi:hypothetical protein
MYPAYQIKVPITGSAQRRCHVSSSVKGLEKLHPAKKKQVIYKATVLEPESDSDYEDGDSSDSSKGGKVMKKTNDKGMPGQNQVGKAAQACKESILVLFI